MSLNLETLDNISFILYTRIFPNAFHDYYLLSMVSILGASKSIKITPIFPFIHLRSRHYLKFLSHVLQI